MSSGEPRTRGYVQTRRAELSVPWPVLRRDPLVFVCTLYLRACVEPEGFFPSGSNADTRPLPAKIDYSFLTRILSVARLQSGHKAVFIF